MKNFEKKGLKQIPSSVEEKNKRLVSDKYYFGILFLRRITNKRELSNYNEKFFRTDEVKKTFLFGLIKISSEIILYE